MAVSRRRRRWLGLTNCAIGANLGEQIGSNFFQSFGLFGLSTSESVSFSGPPTISSVIGRVTGSSPSSINDKIQSIITGPIST
jgi:large exoprotein involved in heme utilization and adhesion